MAFNVLITGKLHPDAISQFNAHPDFKIFYHPDCSREQLFDLLPRTHALVSRSETDVDALVINRAPELKVIARAAVGVGNIDIPLATEKGILVINCPGKNTNAAAELTMGLVLSVLRNIPAACSTVRNLGWDRHRFSGIELRGKTIGLVGLGNVGHRVAQFAHGFDMNVLAYDPYISPSVFDKYHVKPVKTLTQLAAQVNILSFHVPLTKETKGMVNKQIFQAMKPGSYFINASRGEIVNEEDLLAALETANIAGAAIDTWQNEPKPNKLIVTHPKVIGTPHIGASTEEAQKAIGDTVYAQVVKALEGGIVDYPVNLPNIGIIDHPLHTSYTVLGEKLGSLAGQLLDFNPTKVTLYHLGELAQIDKGLIKLAWLRGMLTHIVDDYVSFVNVQSFVDKLGIIIEEVNEPSTTGYSSALKVMIEGAQGQLLVLGGTVFDQDKLRLSVINNFFFEAEPTGSFVLIENWDRVGVVGKIGTFLAEHQINIDSFYLSRDKKGGKAMSLIRVDNEINANDMELISKLENIISTKKFNI